jgi:hypothetical protein
LDISSRYNDSTYNGAISLNDHRPTSATSSVRSQDSGVAQSDPKTSIDCSAKSESSPKVSLNNSNNYYLLNNPPPTMVRHRSSSSSNSNQHLLPSQHQQQQQQQIFDGNIEQLREKLQPFNTQRLKLHRQGTKSMIVKRKFSSFCILFHMIFR